MSLVLGPDGRAHTFWTDDRESHLTPSLYHPRIPSSKVFHRTATAEAQAPPDQVTPRGSYDVLFATPVLALNPDELELVFFRSVMDSGDTLVDGAQDLYLTGFSGKRWRGGKPLLVPASGWRRESIEPAGAWRDATGTLLVLFTAGHEPEDELRILRKEKGRGGRISTLAAGAATHNYGLPATQAALNRDGTLSIVYQASAEKRVTHPMFNKPWYPKEMWQPAREPSPYYLLRTDGTRCLSSAMVSAKSTPWPLFDVAVDTAARTHIVWVENEGDEAVLRHRWVRPVAGPRQ